MQVDRPIPTCGAVINRVFKEKACAAPAVDMLTLLDVDDRTIVKGVLLTCEKYSKDLDHGKKLIFIAEDTDGKPAERIAIQFCSKRK